MTDNATRPTGGFDTDPAAQQGNVEHHIVFLLDVDALGNFVKGSGGPSLDGDQTKQQATADVPSGREGDGGFAPDRLAEVFTRISQVYTQLYGCPTAVSYHMISTKSKFTQEKIDSLKAKIASCSAAAAEAGAGSQNAGGSGGGLKGPETRAPFHVHSEMYALLKALGEPGAAASAQGPSSSTWLENISHHVQHSTGRFIAAMNAAAAHRGNQVKAATFVLVTPAPHSGRPVKPTEPLNPELLAAMRQVNARFMWLDPSGGADVTHKTQMEAAVAAAATYVAEGQPGSGPEGAPAEVQLALTLSSHWRQDGAAPDCMVPLPGLALPLLPLAWLPVADIFHTKAVLESILRRIVALGPPDLYGLLPASFNLVDFHGYQLQFSRPKWFYQVWTETTTLTTTSYLKGIAGNRSLKLPPLRVRAEPHKAAATAKAAPAVAIKGAWQKRGGPPGGQNPHARPPMAPPAPVAGAGHRPGHGGVPGRPGPLTASAQMNVSAGPSGRQPLKAGLGMKPGGPPMGRLTSGSAGPGGASRPQKNHPKANRPPIRPPAPDPAAANNYTLGRAAGKRIAQAIEQGALTGAGPAGTSSKPGNDSQGAAAAAGTGAGAQGAGGAGGGGSRWVWPPLSAAEVAAQAARDGGMVDVDDAMDVGELLRQADEWMHDFISGDLKVTIKKDEKQLRRAQRQQHLGERQAGPQKDGAQHQQQQRGPDAPDVEMQDAESRSAKRQRVMPLDTLQPVLGDARSRLRSKLLVAPTKLSRHEERLPGWQPPVGLVLERAREHTREVVNSLLRASERAVSVAMRGLRKQAAERRARSKGPNAAAGAEAGEQCGEVDPDVVVKADDATASARKGADAGRSGRQAGDDADADQDGVYAAAIDQVFALLQEAWAGDVMAILRERGAVRGRPRLQLCALVYSASRVIHAVEMLGYRRRSPRALVDLLREQLDWAVPLLCHVEGAPPMATFVAERLKPVWSDTWAATLLDLLAVSYAGEDREGNNEMEFVARWDSDEDWEAGMEEAGGVEAATDALEELQRVAAAAVAQQQGSQLGASEPRASGRATSVSHGRQGAAGRTIRQASGSRPGGGVSGAPGGTGPAAGGVGAANAGKAGASQPQVMEVDSLRGVVVAGSQRPAGGGRMAKHVARLDPVRPAHMMPAIIARPIIQIAPDPPPERLAAMREEHRLRQRCGNATANLAGLFDKEAPTPGAAAAPAAAGDALGTAAANQGQGPAMVAAPAAATAAPLPMRAPPDRRPGGPGVELGKLCGAFGGLDGGAAALPGRSSPDDAPAPSGSSTEVGPTPMDDGGRHRSRLPGLEAGGGGGGGGALGLVRGLFTDADAGEVPAVKFNPGGEGVFGQVATFQIVNKPRAAAPAPAPAFAPPVPASQTAAAALPPAMFIFGADVAAPAGGIDHAPAEPRAEAAPAPDEAQPNSADAGAAPDDGGRAVLRLSGGDAAALEGLDDDAPLNAAAVAECGAEADVAGEFDVAGGVLSEDEQEGPPSGCRLQAEEHSADSLLCPKHGDDDDSDSDRDFGDDPMSPRAGQRQPREPVPDACSPCKSARQTGAAAAATTGAPASRLTAGGGGGSCRIPMCAPGGGIMPPRSRKAPAAAAAAAAAAATTGAAGAAAIKGFRAGLAKPPPPRFPAAEAGAGQRSKAPPPAHAVATARQPAQRRQAPNTTQPADATAGGKPAAKTDANYNPNSVDASAREARAADPSPAQQRRALDNGANVAICTDEAEPQALVAVPASPICEAAAGLAASAIAASTSGTAVAAELAVALAEAAPQAASAPEEAAAASHLDQWVLQPVQLAAEVQRLPSQPVTSQLPDALPELEAVDAMDVDLDAAAAPSLAGPEAVPVTAAPPEPAAAVGTAASAGITVVALAGDVHGGAGELPRHQQQQQEAGAALQQPTDAVAGPSRLKRRASMDETPHADPELDAAGAAAAGFEDATGPSGRATSCEAEEARDGEQQKQQPTALDERHRERRHCHAERTDCHGELDERKAAEVPAATAAEAVPEAEPAAEKMAAMDAAASGTATTVEANSVDGSNGHILLAPYAAPAEEFPPPAAAAPQPQAHAQCIGESPVRLPQGASCALAAALPYGGLAQQRVVPATPMSDGPARIRTGEAANGSGADTPALPVPNRTANGATPHPVGSNGRRAPVVPASPGASLPPVTEGEEQDVAGGATALAPDAEQRREEAEQPEAEAHRPAWDVERPAADIDQTMEDASAAVEQQAPTGNGAAPDDAEAAEQPAVDADVVAAPPTAPVDPDGSPAALSMALDALAVATALVEAPGGPALEAPIGCSGAFGTVSAITVGTVVSAAESAGPPPSAAPVRFPDVLRQSLADLASGVAPSRPLFQAQDVMAGGLQQSVAPLQPLQLPLPQHLEQDPAQLACTSSDADAAAFGAAAAAMPLGCAAAGVDPVAFGARQQLAQLPDAPGAEPAPGADCPAVQGLQPQAPAQQPAEPSSLPLPMDLALAAGRGRAKQAGRRRAELLEVPQFMYGSSSPSPSSAPDDGADAPAVALAVDVASVGVEAAGTAGPDTGALPVGGRAEGAAAPGLPSPVAVAAATVAAPPSVAASEQAPGAVLALLSPPGADEGCGAAAAATAAAATPDDPTVQEAGAPAGADADAPGGPTEPGAGAETYAIATQEAAGAEHPGPSLTPPATRPTGPQASRPSASRSGLPPMFETPIVHISAAEAAKLRRQSKAAMSTPPQTGGKGTMQTSGKGTQQTGGKGAPQTSGKGAPSVAGKGAAARAGAAAAAASRDSVRKPTQTSTSRGTRSQATATGATRTTRGEAPASRTAPQQQARQQQTRKRRAGEPAAQEGGEPSCAAAATDAGTAPRSTATMATVDADGNAGPSTAVAVNSSGDVHTQPLNKRRRKGDLVPPSPQLVSMAADAAVATAAAAKAPSQGTTATQAAGGSGVAAAAGGMEAGEGMGQHLDTEMELGAGVPAMEAAEVAAPPEAPVEDGHQTASAAPQASAATAVAGEERQAPEGHVGEAAAGAAAAKPVVASPAHTQVSPDRPPGRVLDLADAEFGGGGSGGEGPSGAGDAGGGAEGEGLEGAGMQHGGADGDGGAEGAAAADGDEIAEGGGEKREDKRGWAQGGQADASRGRKQPSADGKQRVEDAGDGTGVAGGAAPQEPVSAEGGEGGDNPSPATQARLLRRSDRLKPQVKSPPMLAVRETRAHSRAAAAAVGPSAPAAPVSSVSTRGIPRRQAAVAAGGEATPSTKRPPPSRRAEADGGAEDEEAGARRSKRTRR